MPSSIEQGWFSCANKLHVVSGMRCCERSRWDADVFFEFVVWLCQHVMVGKMFQYSTCVGYGLSQIPIRMLHMRAEQGCCRTYGILHFEFQSCTTVVEFEAFDDVFIPLRECNEAFQWVER